MNTKNASGLKYLLVASAGAVIGGVVVLIAGNLIPRAMARMMSEMMSNMMRNMGEESSSPAEF